MSTYSKAEIKRLALSKIAQAKQEVEKEIQQSSTSPMSPTPSKSPTSSKSSSSEIKEVINKASGTLEEKAKDLLTDSSVLNFVDKQTDSILRAPIEKFMDDNKSKIPAYALNQDLLVRDITDQIPIMNYINTTSKALDILLTASSIASLVSLVASLGATSAVVIPVEVAKAAARKSIKDIIKKEGKSFLIKLFTKKAMKIIAKGAAANVSKFFLQEAVRQGTLIIAYNTLISVLTEVPLAAAKNIIIEKGASQFGLSPEVIKAFAHSDDKGVAIKVLEQFKNRTYRDLEQLFSTQQGYSGLAEGVALRMVWKTLGIDSKAMQLNMRASLNHLLSDPSIGNLARLKQNIENARSRANNQQKQEETLLSEQEIRDLLAKSNLPKILQSKYHQIIVDEIANEKPKNKEQAISLVNSKIHVIDLEINAIHDNLKEIAMLNFIKTNQKRFEEDQNKLLKILRDIADSPTAILTELFEETRTKTLDELIEYFKKVKSSEIRLMVKRMSRSNQEDLNSFLINYFEKKANLPEFAEDLRTEYFGA